MKRQILISTSACIITVAIAMVSYYLWFYVSEEQIWLIQDTGCQVATSPDLTQFAACGGRGYGTRTEGEITLFNPNGLRVETFKNEEPICAIGYSHDGKLIAALDSGLLLQIWNRKNELVNKAKLQGSRSLAFSRTDSIIASAGSGFISIFNYIDATSSRISDAHEGSINSILFSPNGQQLYSCGDDALIKIWDTNSMRELSVLRGHNKRVTSLITISDELLISGSWDGTIKMWNVRDASKPKFVKDCAEFGTGIICMAMSPDSSMLAISFGSSVDIISAKDFSQRRTIPVFGWSILSVAFVNNGKLATVSKGGNVSLWTID